MYLLGLLLLPLLIIPIMKYYLHMTITWKEAGLHFLIVVLSTTLMYQGSRYGKMADYEIWNGQVHSKKRERVSCEHSYSCNCSTDSKGNTSCDTCYDHSYDYDWNLSTSVGKYTIQRINRQGTQEPPRWTSSKKGDPVAKKVSYKNVIKGVDDSLFKSKVALNSKLVGMVPSYPLGIYDYHYINRVIQSGVRIPIANYFNREIALGLRTLGSQKQVNVVLIFVNTNDRNFKYALQTKWLGGKKNDAVIIIGTTNYPEISWVDTVSWSKNKLFDVELREELQEIGTIDKNLVNVIMKNISKNFVRRPMEEFDYLEGKVQPSFQATMLILVLNIIISCLIAFWMHRKDVFGDERNGRYRR